TLLRRDRQRFRFVGRAELPIVDELGDSSIKPHLVPPPRAGCWLVCRDNSRTRHALPSAAPAAAQACSTTPPARRPRRSSGHSRPILGPRCPPPTRHMPAFNIRRGEGESFRLRERARMLLALMSTPPLPIGGRPSAQPRHLSGRSVA